LWGNLFSKAYKLESGYLTDEFDDMIFYNEEHVILLGLEFSDTVAKQMQNTIWVMFHKRIVFKRNNVIFDTMSANTKNCITQCIVTYCKKRLIFHPYYLQVQKKKFTNAVSEFEQLMQERGVEPDVILNKEMVEENMEEENKDQLNDDCKQDIEDVSKAIESVTEKVESISSLLDSAEMNSDLIRHIIKSNKKSREDRSDHIDFIKYTQTEDKQRNINKMTLKQRAGKMKRIFKEKQTKEPKIPRLNAEERLLLKHGQRKIAKRQIKTYTQFQPKRVEAAKAASRIMIDSKKSVKTKEFKQKLKLCKMLDSFSYTLWVVTGSLVKETWCSLPTYFRTIDYDNTTKDVLNERKCVRHLWRRCILGK